MSTNKTQPNDASVQRFIELIENDTRRDDAQTLLDLMTKVTGEPAVMWGSSIVGFGSYHYRYESGREGDSPRVAFAARKQAMVVYGLVFYDTLHANNELLHNLGPHSTGKGCLYIKDLSAIDKSVLSQMIKNAYSTKK